MGDIEPTRGYCGIWRRHASDAPCSAACLGAPGHADYDCRVGRTPSGEKARLEAAGRLVIDVAHDLKNIFHVISGYAAYLVEDLAGSPTQRGMAAQIAKISASATGLIGELLEQALPNPSETRLTDVGKAVADARGLLEPLMTGSVSLRMRIADQACWAKVDCFRVRQVLLNLCVNARDAIGGRAGAIEISCQPVGDDHPERTLFGAQRAVRGDALATGGTLTAGTPYVAIAVEDDGIGMNQALLDKAFEPLFSTKHQGRGTGLGLGIVQGLVRDTGGAYAVTSRPGAGTRFSVYWPLVADPA